MRAPIGCPAWAWSTEIDSSSVTGRINPTGRGIEETAGMPGLALFNGKAEAPAKAINTKTNEKSERFARSLGFTGNTELLEAGLRQKQGREISYMDWSGEARRKVAGWHVRERK